MFYSVTLCLFIIFIRSFISKLRDKGKKIKDFREKIVREIERRNEVEEAARLLSKLNIAKDGKSAMNQLEWTGKYSENDMGEKIVELDSDDEEDPIKILAQVSIQFLKSNLKERSFIKLKLPTYVTANRKRCP